MGNVDSLPVVSQAASTLDLAKSKHQRAMQRQQRFIRTFPVISQVLSLLTAIEGNANEAKKIQRHFIDANLPLNRWSIECVVRNTFRFDSLKTLDLVEGQVESVTIIDGFIVGVLIAGLMSDVYVEKMKKSGLLEYFTNHLKGMKGLLRCLITDLVKEFADCLGIKAVDFLNKSECHNDVENGYLVTTAKAFEESDNLCRRLSGILKRNGFACTVFQREERPRLEAVKANHKATINGKRKTVDIRIHVDSNGCLEFRISKYTISALIKMLKGKSPPVLNMGTSTKVVQVGNRTSFEREKIIIHSSVLFEMNLYV